MEFFPSRLTRAESDAMVDGIERHFGEHGFGLWAVEIPGPFRSSDSPDWSVKRFAAPFTPCVEIGWRLAFEHWGRGYATEAARLALGYGFERSPLQRSYPTRLRANHRSRAVMQRLGLRHDPADDFDHPSLPEGHSLQKHVLYRLDFKSYVRAS